ncbi:MAG TPA: DNA methyltransferase [Burkholderiales bacterium]|nr:DNA methyltransferase [Burkholderiales bacterium]
MTRREHPLHSMSSYLGGFPPRTPRRIIQQWVPSRATVLDPFCGSGTTLLEAKLLGRTAIGVDLNPLAVALASAKLVHVDVGDLMFRISDLAKGFRGEIEIDDVPETLEPIFHRRTLAQLCYLRRHLTADTPEDTFLRGCVVGIMHGKARRDGTTAYLSVDMPNTFSMSPNYVRQFVHRNGLRAPPVDVFAKLRERSQWLLRSGPLPLLPRAQVFGGDAARVSDVLERSGIQTVGAIVTSPPYLGVLRYGAFNWIRLWFLGYDQYHIDNLLDGTDSLDRYLSFMVSFLASASQVLRPGGIVALVIGDVVEHGQHVPLANRVWEELAGVVPFEAMEISLDKYDPSSKTTRVWGEDKRGRATPLDRVLVLRRASTRRANRVLVIGERRPT